MDQIVNDHFKYEAQDDIEGVAPVLRQYGHDFIIDVTLWKGLVADGRPFKLNKVFLFDPRRRNGPVARLGSREVQ